MSPVERGDCYKGISQMPVVLQRAGAKLPLVTPEQAARLLRPAAAIVFIGGWIAAIASFFIIGTETCVTTDIPLVGGVETCQDTTATAVVIVGAIGFGATCCAVVLWAISHVLVVLNDISANTRHGR